MSLFYAHAIPLRLFQERKEMLTGYLKLQCSQTSQQASRDTSEQRNNPLKLQDKVVDGVEKGKDRGGGVLPPDCLAVSELKTARSSAQIYARESGANF